ncbi:hypothetical protein BU24DRAFT_278583 [Aaosphaeria arxii CBS 175.79]|uniref:Uncharacterized protein n=1 Tax=Aaosphaeria arxii CBS 175.79 TaxID=1450172 RepID=A0A6A5XE53_9PLEO|nr:uncharacterized protein BU24DRAFT_278583 [Aaosphaeria arxii CBS 175.79]KAF2011322.1 hypothetical protein BU24DRAFT_278583 [Aaosphaeria arxii CBS 175.79]
MRWLQTEPGQPAIEALQLDIVGFLAILGEGSVLANAQVSTLSRWIFLPRLIPAPQALMRPTRPTKLEPASGNVAGVYSGNSRDSINHIANIVCDANNLPEHSVRVVSINRINKEKNLKARTLAPLTFVLFLGFFLSCLLLGLSIWLDDGMSLVSTCLLSSLSTLIGIGNKWTLQLPKRGDPSGKVPRGDVVVRYPKGNFLVVRCDEQVARELYFAPENITYLLQHGPAYRLLSLVGTVMLMGGVICLANAQIQLQIAWAGSYMLLGSAYWIVAALPGKLHWDYSCYEVVHEALSDSTVGKKGYPSESKTFTKALWHAIAVTKKTDWVLRSNACPNTEAWLEWLQEAKAVSEDVREADKEAVPGVQTWEIPKGWDPQENLNRILAFYAKKDPKSMNKSVEEV